MSIAARHRRSGRTGARAGAETRGVRRWFGVAAAIAAGALVTGIALGLWFRPGPGAGAEFGKLPSLDSAFRPSQGAAGGPGYTFDLDYSLSAGLAAGWPGLPSRETVYQLEAPGYSPEEVAGLAAGLGITAPVTREGFQDGFILAADPGDGGPALRAFWNGYIIYSQPYAFEARPRSGLPSAGRAEAVARDWLVRAGFVPAQELGQGQVTEDLENGTLFVRFKPVTPADTVTVIPFANVQVGDGEVIAMGSATWFPTLATSSYALRPVAEGWELVENGQGILEWQTTEYPGPSGEDNVVRGPATVESVRVAWATTFADDGTPYLQPVYVFSGRAAVPGPEGRVSLSFSVWAPAVVTEYVQQ